MALIAERNTPLTRKEFEVLQLLTRGLGHKGIGNRLGISPGTAAGHVKNLRYRLGANNIGHAVAIAYERGLIMTAQQQTTEEKRIEMVRCLMPHSTVVVPTAGLYYHLQKLVAEHHGGSFRQQTRFVVVNNRGDADKVRGHDRVFFDPSCDDDLGSNVAMAEMRRARDAARERNRHLRLSTISGGNADEFVDVEPRRPHFRQPLHPGQDAVEGYESDAERNRRTVHYSDPYLNSLVQPRSRLVEAGIIESDDA